MSKPLFTTDDAWHGGFYELALEIGPRSDKRLSRVLSALWSHPDLDGCFLDRSREPADQPRVRPSILESGSHMLGIARLSDGSFVPCGSCLVREDDGPDWLAFYLPMGALGTAYPVGGFPFGSEADWPGPWRNEIDDWLAAVGLWVAKTAPFRLGLIGFEVSGNRYADEIAEEGIPDERRIGYLWPSNGSVDYQRRTAE